jgi:diacylglycerol kinase family enzyme
MNPATDDSDNDGGHGDTDDRDGDSDADDYDSDRWLILNPVSGDASHADRVYRLAADRGIRVVETDGEGDAAALARAAVAENVRELAVCGGDGTLQEVLSGLNDAGAIRSRATEAIDRMEAVHGNIGVTGDTGDLEDTGDAKHADADSVNAGNTEDVDDEASGTEGFWAGGDAAGESSAADPPILSVIPAGTANIFATDMGIAGVEAGFAVLDGGEVRRLDVGIADGEPFMKSCIAGLTADTSAATSDDLKERFGSLAFVITGVERAADFDPLNVEIDAHGRGSEWSWDGEALCIVIGNARRYVGEVGQANVEDGLLDVTLVEEMPPGSVVTEAIARQLLDRETENVTRLEASHIEIDATGEGPIEFSLDGEIAIHDRLDVAVRRQAVPVRVGPTYDPNPDDS